MSAATGEEWRTRHPKQLHIRSTAGWTNWLEEVGAACRRSKVGVIDEALHLFARVHGYPPASKLVCWVIGYGTRLRLCAGRPDRIAGGPDAAPVGCATTRSSTW